MPFPERTVIKQDKQSSAGMGWIRLHRAEVTYVKFMG
jgi:hypothetical protein